MVNYRHTDSVVSQRKALAFANALLLFRERAAPEEILWSAQVMRDQIQLVTADLGRVNRHEMPVTDALVVAEVTKAVLLVIGPTGNNRATVISVRQQIDRIGARILGATLNGPDDSLVQTHSY